VLCLDTPSGFGGGSKEVGGMNRQTVLACLVSVAAMFAASLVVSPSARLTCGEVDVPRGGRFSRVSESELLAGRGEELGQRSHARADGDRQIQPRRTCER